MSMIDPTGVSAPDTGAARANPLYFAVWRWHFYAGLYVIPFLLMLAVTGLVILWFTAIAPEYGDRLTLTPQDIALSITEQSEAALAAYPGAAIGQYIAPRGPHQPALFRVDLPGDSGARMLALDPYNGKVLKDRPKDGTWNEFVTNIHGTLLMGDTGDRLIEIAAGWGLVLVVSGLYLWWPRKGRGWREMLVPQLSARGRALWKSLHQVTGFWLSLLLVFFLMTGMAWTGIWGGKLVQAWSTFPAEKFDNVPLSTVDHSTMNMGAEKTVPWVLEQSLMPESGSQAGITGLPADVPVGLESVVAFGRTIGFVGRFQVVAPADETGVWTLSQDSMSYDSTNPTADRTVHIDRYTGRILVDIRFANYSLGGKSMAVGVALHEGQMGLWNIVLNAVYCLAMIFLAVSGIVMWWKRRPAGARRLAAPPLPANLRIGAGVTFVTLSLSKAFPLVGLSLIAVLALDLIVISMIPALRRAVS